jgi:hypothetical protein
MFGTPATRRELWWSFGLMIRAMGTVTDIREGVLEFFRTQ